MIYPQNQKHWKKGCLLPSLILFVVLPFLLLGFGALIWFGRESSARRELDARAGELRTQGFPVDDASMQVYYEQRTDPRDTQAWLAVFETLASDDFQGSLIGVPVLDGNAPERVPLPGEPWPDTQTTRDFLVQWQALLEQVSSLSVGAQPVRFPIQFDSVNTLLPHTQEMRQVARLVLVHGQVAVRDRDAAAVLTDIQALLGAAQVNAGEPILISQLVSIAIDGMALRLLKDALKYNVLKRAELEALLADVLVETSIGSGWESAMFGERAMMLPIFRDPKLAQGEVPNIPGRSRDALYYLDFMDRALQAPADDIDEFRLQLADYEAEVSQLAQSNWLIRFDSLVTQMMTGAFSTAGDAFVRKALQHRMAALAIGIRLYEDRHGRQPTNLDELAEIPLDVTQLVPPGGQAFGYRVIDGKAILWGFDLRTASAVPADPPTADDDEIDDYNRELWTWELPRSETTKN